ncbi:hypothetical protein [Kitasatospora sp. NBC_01539]|uniref:hypothetical protein n=1 Tax=Kitasatospora sp. NBC_01539 TaxID=2903577 RepID=UPI00386011D4
MTSAAVHEIQAAAAQAALAHPQVAALQPTLADRLTAAAASLHAASRPPAAVRVHRPPTGTGWHVEVRCIVHRDRRILDTARQVRESVRAALTATGFVNAAESLTVTVTVTGVLGEGAGRPGESATASPPS